MEDVLKTPKSLFLRDSDKEDLYLRRVIYFCTVLIMIISLSVLVSWVFNANVIASVSPSLIPMAPSTAWCFLILSFCLFSCEKRKISLAEKIFIKFLIFLVTLFSLVILLKYPLNLNLDIESIFISEPRTFNRVLYGMMSPIAAAIFLLSCMSFWFLPCFSFNGRRSGSIAVGFSLAVIAFGLVSFVGYLYGEPILYGISIIPVALLTGIGFIILGIGLIFAAGASSWPSRLFTGDSMRSRLMRVLFPFMFGAGLIYEFFQEKMSHGSIHPGLFSALFTVLFLVGTSILISYISKRTGLEIDRMVSERKVAWEVQEAFMATFEQAAVGMVHCAISGDFQRVNRKFCEIIGYSREEVLKLNFRDITHPADLPVDLDNVRRLLDGGIQSYTLEKRYIRKDKNIVWVNITVLLLRDSLGKPAYFIAIVQDISQRKHAEELLVQEHDKAQTYLNIARSVIVVLDQRGTVLLINKIGCEIMGYNDREIIGKNWFDHFIPKRLREEVKNVFSEIIQGSLSREEYYENPVITKDGKERVIAWHNAFLRDASGNIIGGISSGEDITERKHAEAELGRYRENLEELVAERTSKLELAKKELEAFSYTISHDLRVPLRAIDGFSQAIIEDYSDKLDDEAKRLFQVIRNNIKKMGQLIDDLLEFFRLSRSSINIVNVDMNKMLESVWGEVLASEDKARVKMRALPLPPIISDPALMHQVMINLLLNAVKFSSPKDNPVIEVGAEVKENENIYYIKDNGVGFDMQYANKLFKVFQRLHSSDKFDGTGVGLAIVQRIIERLGGRVWAKAQLNEGATFYFALPVKRG